MLYGLPRKYSHPPVRDGRTGIGLWRTPLDESERYRPDWDTNLRRRRRTTAAQQLFGQQRRGLTPGR